MPAHGTTDVTIEIPRGGALNAALALPDGASGASLPGVIVLHEIWGLNDDMRRIAARFASNGYAAIAPDLYSNGTRSLCLSRVLLDTAFADGQRTLASIEAVRAWLADRPDVDETRIGVIGFCFGGGYALLFGTRGSVGVASVNYGSVPKERSKLTGVCPVVASFGALDRQFAPHGPRLEEHLSALGVPYDVKVYEGAGHSFWSYDNAPQWLRRMPKLMEAGYNEDAAEDAWARTLAFFAEHLPAANA